MLVVGVFFTVLFLTFSGVGYFFHRSCSRLKQAVELSWEKLSASLMQRQEELPKLIEVSTPMHSNESLLVEKLLAVDKRFHECLERNGFVQMDNEESLYGGTLKQFFEKCDRYPMLRVDKSYKQLKSKFSKLLKEIDSNRQAFNADVELYNNEINRFPASIVCKALRLERIDTF